MSMSGPTLRSGFVSVDSYHGKVVLVDFWATWCGPCRREMPTIRRLHETYGRAGFAVIGVSLDSDRDKLFHYVQSNDLGWPQIHVSSGGDSGWENPIAKTYEVKSIPRTFLVGRRGTIVAVGLRGQELETAIVSELAK
jgi:thiol-disulfide isomerase/thioredoxin